MGFLHIGQNVMVNDRHIIGIFDLDITSQSPQTGGFWTRRKRTAWSCRCATTFPSRFWCATTRITGRSCIFPS